MLRIGRSADEAELRRLLAREEELQLRIDTLIESLAVLEADLSTANPVAAAEATTLSDRLDDAASVATARAASPATPAQAQPSIGSHTGGLPVAHSPEMAWAATTPAMPPAQYPNERSASAVVDGKGVASVSALDGSASECIADGDDVADPNSFDEFEAPEWCVPIKANVLDFEWDALAEACQFDIISMDPPWQLASHAPTRGVAIGYQQLPDLLIETLPIEKLQTNGFIFIWVINNKYAKAFDLMTKWGYEYVDDITWVKQTVNRRMAKGHGYYLQHAKETCLVGRKGNDPPGCRHGVASDVIFSERRGQSQKPEEIYLMMEELVPNGKYLEIFGRKNNLRDYWITIGNEL
ncbi:MT-A70-domain-containing protein [Entophlyctis helioformis]|nr:MT-A70-domain-containing protein [Entophlyctis helioformis]